jgi:arylsulfatase
MYYTMVPTGNPADALLGAKTFHWTQVDNIKRDPFEMATGETQGTMLGYGGALAGPVTAYIYDWNVLPIGQLLWLKELETYIPFPPLQSPESYNLTQVLEQVKQALRWITVEIARFADNLLAFDLGAKDQSLGEQHPDPAIA